MGVLKIIGSLFSPAVELIRTFKLPPEEKMRMEVELTKLQNSMSLKLLEYEAQLLQSREKIITAEATGGSWIQKNWRPITMLTFLQLVVLDSFGWLPNPLAKEAWTLLQIGLGGYVTGRTFEKIAPQLKGLMGK